MSTIATILSPKLGLVMELLIDNYLSQGFHHEHYEISDAFELKKGFEKLAHTIIHTTTLLDESDYRHFVDLNLKFGIPYGEVISELGFIKEQFIHQLLEESNSEGVVFLCKVYAALSSGVAAIYLDDYIKKLFSRNNIRLISLSGMQENIVQFYAAHIIWLNDMIAVMKQRDTSIMPELNPSHCHFGKWLEGDGKTIVSNNSKFKSIFSLHRTLHFIGSKIEHMLLTGVYDAHTSMTYLERAERISLEIGAELALIDNRIIMTTAAKDSLTDLLNRSLLEQMFYDQYEIALITQKRFVLVMCDLDNFKNVNDSYGHSEGDAILKLFSKTLRDKLRSSDLIFRFGGDEFMIILPATDAHDVINIFRSVARLFQQYQTASPTTHNVVTMSAGVLEITPEATTLSQHKLFQHYLTQVDQRLYLAKESGRNRVE